MESTREQSKIRTYSDLRRYINFDKFERGKPIRLTIPCEHLDGSRFGCRRCQDVNTCKPTTSN